MSYSSEALVEALLGRDLTANEQLLLPYIFASVDAYIDDQTGITWGSATATKYFDGSSFPNGYVSLLSFPGASAITSVSYIDSEGTTVDTFDPSDYVLGPLNSPTKTYVEFRNRILLSGVGNIAITGTFGGGDIPQDIIYLATYLSVNTIISGSYLGADTTGPVKSESLEGYSRTYVDSSSSTSSWDTDPVVMGILTHYTDDEILL